MQKREETEEKRGPLGNHPRAYYGLCWTIPKWLLVILFIVFVLALLDFSRIMAFVLIIVAIAVPPVIIKIKEAGSLRDLVRSMQYPSAIIKVKEDGLRTIQIVFVYYIVLIIAAIALMMMYKRSIIQIVAIIAVIVFALMMVMKFKWIKDLKNQNSIRTSKKEECEKENLRDLDAWEAYKQADNLYHQRFNFFLVAESMLVVSFATTVSSGSLNTNPVRIAITILGMIFTFSWFYVNNSIGYRMIYLREKGLRRCNPTYRSYLNVEEKLSIPSEFFMTDLLPAATFVFWCYLLYITVKLV